MYEVKVIDPVTKDPVDFENFVIKGDHEEYLPDFISHRLPTDGYVLLKDIDWDDIGEYVI